MGLRPVTGSRYQGMLLCIIQTITFWCKNAPYLATVTLIAQFGEKLTLWSAALHTWLGWALLHQSISAGRAVFSECRPEPLTKDLSLHKQMTPLAFLPSFSHLWTVPLTQTPRGSFLLPRVHGRRGPGLDRHRFPQSKCCFLQDKPGKVWRGFSCSVFGERKVMNEQKHGASFSVKPEGLHRWLQV